MIDGDVGLASATALGEVLSVLVELSVRSGNVLLVEVSVTLRVTSGARVLAKNDALAEHGVVLGLVRFLGFCDAMEAGAVVLGVGVTVVALSAYAIVGGGAAVGVLFAVLAGVLSVDFTATISAGLVRAVTISGSVGTAIFGALETFPQESAVAAASIASDTKAVDVTVGLAAVEGSSTVGTSEAGAIFAFSLIAAVFATTSGESLALLVAGRSAVNLAIGSVVSCTCERTTSSDSSAAHDTLAIAELELSLLVALLPFTLSRVAFTAVASVHTNLLEGTIVLLAVMALTLLDTITMAIDTIVALAMKTLV